MATLERACGVDPVSVQGMRGASSKYHGFSGARRPGRRVLKGSQVCVVVGEVSGLSCVSGTGNMWGPDCCDQPTGI